MALVEHLATPDRVTAAYELLSRYSEERLGSDARLDSILRALNETVKKNRVAKAESWKIPSGKRGARIESKAGKTTIIFEDKAVPDFALFVSGKLDELYKEFREYRGEGDKL